MELASLSEVLEEEGQSFSGSQAFQDTSKAVQSRLLCFAMLAHVRSSALKKRKRPPSGSTHLETPTNTNWVWLCLGLRE